MNTVAWLDDGRLDLGASIAQFALPARIEIDGLVYFLIRGATPASYQLLSAVCPHLGGEIADAGDCFECPNHGWRFDRSTGRGLTSPSARMAAVPVDVINGRLVADLSHASWRAPSRKAPAPFKARDVSITLHAHACLELRHAGFSLLTDPWLRGPAFLGAWTQYPPPSVDVSSLQPDAILISHEHSDHLHEPTLTHFDRSTPVYFPDFPNRRIADRLAGMGFTRAAPMRFGEVVEIAPDVALTCFEPGSLWNDAVVLIEIGGLRLLNLNDAGLNRRIARIVHPVDVIASAFSPGASGYPLTWTHVDDEAKAAILHRAGQGMLRMLRDAAEMYGASAVLPFAGHFSLWHPSHETYVRAMQPNTIDDVVRAFEGDPARVIDLLPGETWDVERDHIRRSWTRAEGLYEQEKLLGYLRRAFDATVFDEHHPSGPSPSRFEIEHYFLRLNETPEIAFCEDLTVTLDVIGPGAPKVSFEIANGVLRVLGEPPASPNLTIEIPGGILDKIITENLSWDEAHIGYWCRFSRQPDLYHAGFWRLLQAPYFAKPAALSARVPAGGSVTDAWIIADVLEKFGDQADRIVRRYGLYCAGCQHSTADTLAQGARQHGLDEPQLHRLIHELNRALVTHSESEG